LFLQSHAGPERPACIIQYDSRNSDTPPHFVHRRVLPLDSRADERRSFFDFSEALPVIAEAHVSFGVILPLDVDSSGVDAPNLEGRCDGAATAL